MNIINIYKEQVIRNFINKTKNKEQIFAGLKELEKKEVDIKTWPSFELARHLLKYLGVSVTPQDREVLESLWGFKKENREIFEYDLRKTPFGRSLLSQSDNKESIFNMCMMSGTIRDLKEFLEKNPDFFKGESNKITDFSLKKVLLCEKFGMTMTPNILKYTIGHHKNEDLVKLFNFVYPYKPSLRQEHWDEIITILIRRASSENYTSKPSKPTLYGDIYTLIDELYKPEEFSINRLYKEVLIKTKNCNFFSKEAFSLSEEERAKKWVNSLLKLNTERLIFSNLSNFFLNYESYNESHLLKHDWSPEEIEPIILKQLKTNFDSLFSYASVHVQIPQVEKFSKEPRDWAIKSSYYEQLFKNPVYSQFLLNEVFNQCDEVFNKIFFTHLSSISKSNKEMHAYDFYLRKELEYPERMVFSNKILKSIVGQNFNQELYEKTKFTIKLDVSLDKKESRPKIKI